MIRLPLTPAIPRKREKFQSTTGSAPSRMLLVGALAAVLCLGVTPAWGQAEVWVNGLTEPINDVTLSVPLAGIIGLRPFKEGDFVKAGQAVVELDKKLEELEVSRRKLMMDLHKTDLDGTKALFEKKALSISREELDKKLAEYSVAAVEYELAKEQLKRRQVFTPFDGVITDLPLEVGEACQAQQTVARVVDARRCYFVSNVEARSGYSLKAGQKVKLEVEAGAKPVPFEGTIYFISPVVDPASGLLKIKVVFENADGKIRPGVAARMLLEEAKDGK